ncbi:Zinc finger FYVE domain-containing protein 1 [Hondaea fermentalgiana]|uniref:Zinc finger FYVE domain-containing protein 1 n=1 Tax=Hondaea fermentalgiana TaxID=2315210 RepID=A0A2R5FYF0_9STRA|nr:Zinc finger FYVE domain-containing protein 1 [Hondaea fermentalgiana]|eukprot:GBG23782.1 Zinc finger FYVE domain-containing protein 1 [Hondaea fermentalgiana]
MRDAASRLLAPHGAQNDLDGQRAAVATLYASICDTRVDANAGADASWALGPLRVDLLGPLLYHVNDESAPRRLRIQACRVLTALLGGSGNATVASSYASLSRLMEKELSGNELHDVNDQVASGNEDVDRGNEAAAPEIHVHEREEIEDQRIDQDKAKRKRSLALAKNRKVPGARQAILGPKREDARLTQKRDQRPRAERKGLIGVLLGRDASHAKQKRDTRRFMGYEVPMLWYPKTSEALRERRQQNLQRGDDDDEVDDNNDNVLSRNGHGGGDDASKRLKLPLLTPPTKSVRTFPRIEDASVEELDRVLEQERALWRAIDRGIREKRLALPSNFLLEQGLEVAYAREVARRVLDRLFRYAGREPLRGPFRRWHAHTLELRFQEFARYASLEKLRQIIRRMLSLRVVRAWDTWSIFVDEIRKQERLAAAIALQRRYRGKQGRRVFAAHKERWYAARRIQTWRRMLCKVTAYTAIRTKICLIQRNERKWSVRRMILRWHAAAVPIQAMARMRPRYLWFLRVKAATLMIQANYRGVLGRVRFKHLFNEFALNTQYHRPAALRIQRCWHRHRAFATVRAIYAHELAINNAALAIQKQWYIYKEEFPAFVMMRVYLIQDKVDKIEARLEKRARRAEAARKIQTVMRGVYAQRLVARHRIEHHAAIPIQSCARGFVARQRVHRFAALLVGVRRIQNLVRAYFAPRHAAAARIQIEVRMRLLQSVGASMISLELDAKTQAHFSSALRQPLATRQEDNLLRARASIVLQTRLARSMAAKKEFAQRRAARLLQRIAKGYLGRCRARHCARVVRHNAARAFVEDFVSRTHAYMSDRIFARRAGAACRIQSWYKERKAQIHAKALRKWHARRTKGARTIQRIVRGVQGRRHLARDRELDRRVRTNRYKGLQDPREIAETAIMHARAFYDTADPMAGMHPSLVLHRLGLGHLWEPLYKGAFHVNDLSKLCSIPDKALREFLSPFCESESDAADVADLVALVGAIRLPLSARHSDASHARVLRRFAYIRDPFVARRVYAAVFPDQTKRAESFAMKLPPNTVTRAQLHRYMLKYRGRPKEAKDHAEAGLLALPDAEAVTKWDLRRFRQCAKVYEMALETIGKRALTDELRLVVADALLRAQRPDAKEKRGGCNEMRVALDLVIKLVTAACKVQQVVRAKLARVMVRACLARKRYREDLLEGGILRKNWQLEREKEAREYEEYLQALARYEVEQGLAKITRFGYLEVWDEYAQAYYYTDENGTAEAVWERPVYTFEEDVAARKMQLLVRGRAARNFRRALEEARRRQEEMAARQRAWEDLAHERLNLVTFRVRLETVMDDSEAQKIPMFPSWRRKPLSWKDACRDADVKLELAALRLGEAQEALANAIQAVEASAARRDRGREPGDAWYAMVKTGKRDVSFDTPGSILAHWGAIRDEETGRLRFKCRLPGHAGLRDSLADLERQAMHLEDAPALELQKVAAEMLAEDAYSRQCEVRAFVETRLPHVLTLFTDPEATSLSYDLKARLREEARAATRLAALTRGHLARRTRREARLDAAREHAERLLERAKTSHEDAASVRARLHVPVGVSAVYTFVDMPFGWRAKRDGYGRTFYVHDTSFDTVWARPTFVWEEQVAAGIIQRVYRGWRGRCAFIEALRSEGVRQVAEMAIAKAATTACFEYPASEGVSVEIWLARRGLHEIVRDVLVEQRSVEKRTRQRFRSLMEAQALPWTRDRLAWFGIKREDHVSAIMASEKVPEEKLCLLREADAIEALFLSHYPSQGARALKFAAQAAQLSDMPITMCQLETHLAKYKGKPSLATVQLQDEVFNLPTTSTPQDQEAAFYLMLGASRRIMIIAANMKLEKLHGELRELMERAQTLLSKPEEGQPPGPWLCRRPWPREAMAAFAMRETLERALAWEKMAVRVQRVYRDYRNLMQWREVAAWYRSNITLVQCAWRQYAARKLLRLRHAQYHSSWEELFDPKEDMMYYFDNSTDKSQWHPPREPYKPYGWWPPHPDDIPVPEGKCFVCRQHEAVRLCEECVTKNGVNREFCFDCFAEVHGSGGAAMARHSFRAPASSTAQVEAGTSGPGLVCSQCQGPGIRRCNDCEDFYCLACFRRLHGRGRRREHAWTAYQAGCPVCVECERQVAAVYCESCRDHLCKACSTRIHRKGQRKRHTRVDLADFETKSGQGL